MYGSVSFWVSFALVLCTLGTALGQDRTDVSGDVDRIRENERHKVPDEYGAIVRLTGEDNPENIDSQTFEQLSQWLSHPLPLNLSSRSRLLSSGLFTPYQAATITDYRERSGDILSLAELALIDGFSSETAAALAPFITFRSDALPGQAGGEARGGKASGSLHKLQFRNSVRLPRGEGCELNYGMKYRLTAANGIEAGIALGRGYMDKDYWPAGGTFFLAYYGKDRLGKVVVGDYNLRFGQGLAVWTGFRMSSVSFPDSFYRRSYGISPCISYSTGTSLKGVAADFVFGKFTLALSLGLEGLDNALARKLSGKDFPEEDLSLSPCANLAWTGRNITASFTVAGTSGALKGEGSAGRFSDVILSGDFRCCVRGVDIFSEAAFNAVRGEASAIAGTVFRPGDRLEAGVFAKYLKDTWCIALGGRFSAGRKVSLAGESGFGSTVARHSGNFTLEGTWFDYEKYKGTESGGQIRLTFNYFLRLSPFISLDFRLTQRNRTAGERNRSQLRSRFVWTDGIWRAAAVADVVHCSDFGVLGYAEGGHSSGKFSCHLRAGAFRIDNWEDRIYVYERDMPGNFNVPAFRGRGLWVSAYFSFKPSGVLRLYLRTGCTGYPFEEDQKNFRPARTEVKVGAVLEIKESRPKPKSRESSVSYPG